MTMLPQLMLVNGHKINNHLVQIPNIRYDEKRKENELDKSRAVVLRERAQDVVFGERESEQFGNVAFGWSFFPFFLLVLILCHLVVYLVVLDCGGYASETSS